MIVYLHRRNELSNRENCDPSAMSNKNENSEDWRSILEVKPRNTQLLFVNIYSNIASSNITREYTE